MSSGEKSQRSPAAQRRGTSVPSWKSLAAINKEILSNTKSSPALDDDIATETDSEDILERSFGQSKVGAVDVTSQRNQQVIAKAQAAASTRRLSQTTESALDSSALKRPVRNARKLPTIATAIKVNAKPSSTTSRKTRNTSNPSGKHKRVLSAYNYFVAANHPKLKKKHPGLHTTEIIRMVAHAWKSLSDEDRLQYIQQERKARAEAGVAESKIGSPRQKRTTSRDAKSPRKKARTGTAAQKPSARTSPRQRYKSPAEKSSSKKIAERIPTPDPHRKAYKSPARQRKAAAANKAGDLIYPEESPSQKSDGTFTRPRGRAFQGRVWDKVIGAWARIDDNNDDDSAAAIIASPPRRSSISATSGTVSTSSRKVSARKTPMKGVKDAEPTKPDTEARPMFRPPGGPARKLDDGTFNRPKGKKPRGYDWDRKRGMWVLQPDVVNVASLQPTRLSSAVTHPRAVRTRRSNASGVSTPSTQRKRKQLEAVSSLEMLLQLPPSRHSTESSGKKRRVGSTARELTFKRSDNQLSRTGGDIASRRMTKATSGAIKSSPLPPRGTTQPKRGRGRPKGSKNKPRSAEAAPGIATRTDTRTLRSISNRSSVGIVTTTHGQQTKRFSQRNRQVEPSPGTLAAAEILGHLQDEDVGGENSGATSKTLPSYVACGRCSSCQVPSNCGSCLSCMQMLDVPLESFYRPVCAKRICVAPVFRSTLQAGPPAADSDGIESLSDHDSFVAGAMSEMSEAEDLDETCSTANKSFTGADLARKFHAASQLLDADSDAEELGS